jgi:hypothetical protein
MPSGFLDNTDSRISSDVDQMFREFFNVVAIFLTNTTQLLALMGSTFPKSNLTKIAVLSQFLFAAVCLPVAKKFAGPVAAAVAKMKKGDGDFNFLVRGLLALHIKFGAVV